MSSRTSEIIDILMSEAESTDMTAEHLLPLIQEVMKVESCYDRELLCEKLTLEAKVFNLIPR